MFVTFCLLEENIHVVLNESDYKDYKLDNFSDGV